MNLDPQSVQITKTEVGLSVHISDQVIKIERLARAFPRTNPEQYISLMDPEGHEIGIIEDPDQLEPSSRELVDAELKAIYFVPLILAIRSVAAKGTGSFWEIDTDDGPRSFRIIGRDALNGDHVPSIEIHDENGKRYKIENYWELDADSRDLIADLLPDKTLKARYARSGMHRGGGSGKGGMSRGGMGGGGMGGGGMR